MDPLAIFETFDRIPDNEILEHFANWILELSLGKKEYQEDGEHLVNEASSRYPNKSIRNAVSLALAAAEMRMDMAMSENYQEPSFEKTSHKRKIELIDNLVVRELELLLKKPMTESTNSKIGVKNMPVKTFAGSKIADDNESDLVDIIKTSYEKVGGNPYISKSGDISARYSDWVLMDTDEDPEVDVALFGKPAKSGIKLGAMATDGTSVAKQAVLELQGQLYRNGWWAEVSDAPAHIAINKLKLFPIEDEEAVRELLGKDIEWYGEHPEGKFPGTNGWYSRIIGGTPHIKTIVGNV
jgi:hypothetical protein